MLKESYYTEPTEVDQLIFAKLVPPEHYLRQVKRLIDFERFRDLVTDCYSPALGRSAEDPVRLIKLGFLQRPKPRWCGRRRRTSPIRIGWSPV